MLKFWRPPVGWKPTAPEQTAPAEIEPAPQQTAALPKWNEAEMLNVVRITRRLWWILRH